jgi:hypothetical protein
MPDYQNGKIYKIIGGDECYVGSTTTSLAKRFSSHKRDMDTTAKLLFDKYGIENCKIELIELFPCQTRIDLNKREGIWIIQLKSVNRCIAGRTPKETQHANYIKNKEHKKKYRDEHKEDNKEYHKAYREANREKIVAYLREYHKKKREEQQ